eukprot:2985928-Prymnesium_polylepis.1
MALPAEVQAPSKYCRGEQSRWAENLWKGEQQVLGCLGALSAERRSERGRQLWMRGPRRSPFPPGAHAAV